MSWWKVFHVDGFGIWNSVFNMKKNRDSSKISGKSYGESIEDPELCMCTGEDSPDVLDRKVSRGQCLGSGFLSRKWSIRSKSHICYTKYLALKTSLHRGWAQSIKISIHHFRCSNNTCYFSWLEATRCNMEVSCTKCEVEPVSSYTPSIIWSECCYIIFIFLFILRKGFPKAGGQWDCLTQNCFFQKLMCCCYKMWRLTMRLLDIASLMVLPKCGALFNFFCLGWNFAPA